MMLGRGLGALLLLAVLAGCGKDEIVDPGPPDSLPFPETPDLLMSNLQAALARRDLAAYGNTIAPSFRFWFRLSDVFALSLPHDNLNACEERTAAAHLLGGLPVTNCRGAFQAAIQSVQVLSFAPVDDWETVPGDAPLFPGTTKRAYDLQIRLDRSNSSVLLTAGRHEFYVVSRDSLLPGQGVHPFWQIAGQVELETGPKHRDEISWGGVKTLYLTNQTPEAVLIIDPPAGPAGTVFTLDGSGSRDPDGDGHPLAYRWRIDNGAWTQTPAPTTVLTLYGPATCAVEFEVQDGWGATGQASRAISITTAFPDTPNRLMTNWLTAYLAMDIDRYRDVIHPGFLFVFTEDDINAGLFPTTPLTREEELAGSERMFGGEPGQMPGGDPVAPISSIWLSIFNPLSDWMATPPDDPQFPHCSRRLYEVRAEFFRTDTSKITVQGQQEFYVAARDSVVDDVVVPFYQLRGWRDFSVGGLVRKAAAGRDAGDKPSLDWTWGYLKAVYF